jgi:hypothetical protein
MRRGGGTERVVIGWRGMHDVVDLLQGFLWRGTIVSGRILDALK